MTGNQQVIAQLQAQLKILLTAINQYYVHYRMLSHWSFDLLGKADYKASIVAMKDVNDLMERIFMLEGLPNLQDLGKLRIGEDVPEILQCNLTLELESQLTLKDGITQCEAARDYVSRDLLEKLLDKTEDRIDFLENQLTLIEQMNLENYLQAQVDTEASHH